MDQVKSLLTSVFLIHSFLAFGQINDTQLTAKADRFKQELSALLSEKAIYPQDALSDRTWGDVIVTCELGDEGKFLEPAIKESPDLRLSAGSVVALGNFYEFWETKKPDYFTTGRDYIFIFRYRIYANALPVDNKARAMKLYSTSKYEKALKAFDKAIRDNEYDHQLYRFRAKCKESLEDAAGAVRDHAKADSLNSKVMAVIDVIKLQAPSYNSVRITGDRIVAVPVR